jgi:hypothetical protein
MRRMLRGVAAAPGSPRGGDFSRLDNANRRRRAALRVGAALLATVMSAGGWAWAALPGGEAETAAGRPGLSFECVPAVEPCLGGAWPQAAAVRSAQATETSPAAEPGRPEAPPPEASEPNAPAGAAQAEQPHGRTPAAPASAPSGAKPPAPSRGKASAPHRAPRVESAKGRLRVAHDSWVYAKPARKGAHLARLPAGRYVVVTGSTPSYVRIRTRDGASGFVPMSALALTAPADKVFVLTRNSPVLAAPNHLSRRLARVHKGHLVHVVGISLGYIKIRMRSGLEGFIPARALE